MIAKATENTAAAACDQCSSAEVVSSVLTAENIEGVRTINTSNGDVLKITESHEKRAALLFDLLRKKYNTQSKIAIAVGGPSGSGKSEIGALLCEMYESQGIKAILVACDNYPIRAPKYNDIHRRQLFETEGRQALADYLGSNQEILFSRLSQICNDFCAGAETINLRRIHMQTNQIDDVVPVQVNGAQVIVFEGTWSCRIPGLSEAVFLDTDYKDTAAHRNSRARVEIQDEDNRRFIEDHVLPLEQTTLTNIKEAMATLWLRYANAKAEIIERKEQLQS